MGFSWRGKTSERPVSNDAGETTGSEPIDVGAGGVGEPNLRRFKAQHQWDPFLEIEKLDVVDDAIRTGDPEKEAAIGESLLEEDSPYPEVRSSVRPLDDPDLPVNTIRAWFLGFILCTIVAACNILLGLRRSPIIITATVVQLIAYP